MLVRLPLFGWAGDAEGLLLSYPKVPDCWAQISVRSERMAGATAAPSSVVLLNTEDPTEDFEAWQRSK